jgi:hypothetical protein
VFPPLRPAAQAPQLIGVQGPRSCCQSNAAMAVVVVLGANSLAQGFGERPRMSMQRDTLLPRIQPAHGWARSMGRARPSSWCRARKSECRCNGTFRCRASNPRRVGYGRRNRAGFLVAGARGRDHPLLGRDATGGRSASLAKLCCATTHRLPCAISNPCTPVNHAAELVAHRNHVEGPNQNFVARALNLQPHVSIRTQLSMMLPQARPESCKTRKS